MRLFAALPLSVAAQDRLTRLRLRLSAPRDGLRWSEPEQWHLTLQFFGDLQPAQAEDVQQAFAAWTEPAAELALTELALFAGKGILLVAVESSPALLQLHASLRRLAQSCGLRTESRAFVPHITLARSKGKAGLKTLQKLTSTSLPVFGAPVRWVADQCSLLQSELTPQGAVYSEVAARALRGAESEPGA